jgi:hypothetical protein
LKNAPFGLYAVVPSAQHPLGVKQYDTLHGTLRDILKPGVVLCLKQRGATTQGESVNPLQPYFLVYVRDDGTVRYNYVHAKQVLEMYRMLCAGREEAYEQLCRLFDSETDNGADMGRYNELIEKAATAIATLFRKRAGVKLTSDRSALLIPDSQQASSPDDFDLVTWLVIK